MHKAWSSIEEVPYCFSRSYVKLQGHTAKKIIDFDPNWAFPDYRPVAAFKSLRFALFILYVGSKVAAGALFYLYQPFPLLAYFSVVVCLRWLYYHMLSVSYISRVSWILFLLLLCNVMVCANNRIHNGPSVVSFVLMDRVITRPLYSMSSCDLGRIFGNSLLCCDIFVYCPRCME